MFAPKGCIVRVRIRPIAHSNYSPVDAFSTLSPYNERKREMLKASMQLSGAIMLAFMATAPVSAQPYGDRWDNRSSYGWNSSDFWREAPRDAWARINYMQQRIDRGIQDGSLTRNEGRRLQRELERIRRDARRWRRGSDRDLRLQARLDDLGRSIRWERRDNQFATDYDASRYYREDIRYQERRLNDQDYVYRGSDGRYYCKRSDGTIGLIIGGVTGGVVGNVIDSGRNRTAGTLIGGALGALAGRAIQRESDVRCR